MMPCPIYSENCEDPFSLVTREQRARASVLCCEVRQLSRFLRHGGGKGGEATGTVSYSNLPFHVKRLLLLSLYTLNRELCAHAGVLRAMALSIDHLLAHGSCPNNKVRCHCSGTHTSSSPRLAFLSPSTCTVSLDQWQRDTGSRQGCWP
jgi:hypothetical protein